MSYLDYAGLTRFKNKSLEDFASKFSNPNLLINSNFAINQRGQTSYTITGGKKPCVDRVLTNNSVIEPQTGGGIKINIASGQSNPYIQQVLENATSLVGKKLTLSIKIDGTIYTHTANTVVPSADSTTSYYNQSFTCGNYAVNLQLVKFKPSGASDSIMLVTFTIGNPNDTIIDWWKLEVGDVATAYTPPLIAEELPKCQRYYQLFGDSTTLPSSPVDYRPTIRTTPTTGTITISGTTYKYADAEMY